MVACSRSRRENLDAEDKITETSGYFRGNLYIRRLGEPDAVPVTGAEDAWQATFAPDGSRLAYVKRDNRFGGKIETIAVTGGRPTTLTSANEFIFGLDWSEDGRIVFGTIEGLRSIPEAGGAIMELTTTNADARRMIHAFPHVLPGGVGILYTVVMESTDPAEITIRLLDTASGQSRELLKNASNARYARGHLAFARDHTMHAVPFDLETMTLGGEPQPLGLSVVQSHWAPNDVFVNGAAQFAVSETGDLAYAQGGILPELPLPLAWVDRSGEAEVIESEPGTFAAPRVDAGGRRLLLSNFYLPNKAIWMHDLARGVTGRLRRDAVQGWVCWGPGPDDYTFHLDDSGIPRLSWASLGSTAKPFMLDPPPGMKGVLPAEWSPDQRHLLCIAAPARGLDSELFTWSEDEGWANLTETPDVAEMWPTLSPDGRWIAFAAGERFDDTRVYVRPFLRDGPAIQVSTTGSSSPLWSLDGTELYYRSHAEEPVDSSRASASGSTEKQEWILAAPVNVSDAEIDIGRPERLFRADDYVRLIPIRSWDIGPDGRFLMPMRASKEDILARIDAFFPTRIRLIQNWTSTLGKPGS
jgi:hypothetical protein